MRIRTRTLLAAGSLTLILAACGTAKPSTSTQTTSAPTTAAARPTTASPSTAAQPTAAPTTPKPTAAPTTPKPTAPPTTKPSLTSAQEQAIRATQQYLSDGQGFSRQGLIDQLDSQYGAGFSVADATFAVDSLHEDWAAQAVISAKNYLSTQAFSCTGLVQQLSSPYGGKFTVAEAEHGANAAGIC